MNLKQLVEDHSSRPDERLDAGSREAFAALIRALDRGEARAAEPDDRGGWKVNAWVKQGILLGFRLGRLRAYDLGSGFRYFDRDTFPLRAHKLSSDTPRLVPGGSAIRTGVFIGRSVTLMPPCYVNVGAWIDEETMIDSHALVGSCAQVGRRVHVSAGTQIGGVLEPVGALPVIVEDEVLLGGNCGLYEGTIVRRRAVLGAGTILTASVPLYDAVKGEVRRAGPGRPLEVPQGAVVVPGSRPARGSWAVDRGLQLYAPVIVKYRDERTDAATALEQALR
jgi:2,3,4,5-tetrahydropyridine-2-carboxylate N-succinyltransferase